MKPLYQKLLCRFFAVPFLLALTITGCQNAPGSAEQKNEEEVGAPSNANAEAASNDNTITLNDNEGNDYNPTIDPANFVSTIDNPYLNLTPGKVWIYQGTNEDGETERIEVEVTQDTKTILGVVTTVVRDREWVDGELLEDTFDWFAQDKDGNVWYFGEDTKEFENGEVVSTSGSWEAGVNGAKAGIVMKGNPQVGEAYRQEFLQSEAEDMGQILNTNAPVSIGLGNYEDCLQTKDWTPLEPDVVEHKFYSKKVGNVILEKKVAGESGQMELIEVKTAATEK